ncbi:MAG: alpha-L-fucosidase, partial [Verrucomicrobia bacterium]|nr:alpha-L-fucosidase [Verrucomicrobiota bacterium]
MKNIPPEKQGKAPEKFIRWFREARYGMFIHFGLYSILGRHEWALCYERIPFEEYRKLARRFNPKHLDVRAWADLARKSGMRYACLTTRHHEGFALFDTQASDFNSVNSPARRDLVREYVEACRNTGLGVGLYYSVADWGDPGFLAGPRRDPKAWKRFVRIVHEQLRELMTRYGRVDYLFYDGCPPPKTWGCATINAEIRRLQPHILISSRCGLDEDVISAEGHTISDPGKLWESCLTTNSSWGYNYGDDDWKTP